MRVLRRRLVLLASIFLSITSFLGSSDRVFGQTGGFSPSADQIEMFKNLSPDQQQAIIQSLGGGSGGAGISSILSGLGGSSSTSSDRSRSGLNADQQDNGNNRRRPSDDDEEHEPAVPVLRGDDSVIIEIDFHLAPRPLPSTVTALNGATGPQLPSAQNIQAYQAAMATQSPSTTSPGQAPLPTSPQVGNNTPPGFSSLVQPSDDPYAP